jgi:hypothetical protein
MRECARAKPRRFDGCGDTGGYIVLEKKGQEKRGGRGVGAECDGVFTAEDTEKGSQKGWRVGSKGGGQSQREEFSGDSVLERE